MIIDAIPSDLKYAISGGIGLFIAFLGLSEGGIIVSDDSTLVALGSLSVGYDMVNDLWLGHYGCVDGSSSTWRDFHWDGSDDHSWFSDRFDPRTKFDRFGST